MGLTERNTGALDAATQGDSSSPIYLSSRMSADTYCSPIKSTADSYGSASSYTYNGQLLHGSESSCTHSGSSYQQNWNYKPDNYMARRRTHKLPRLNVSCQSSANTTSTPMPYQMISERSSDRDARSSMLTRFRFFPPSVRYPATPVDITSCRRESLYTPQVATRDLSMTSTPYPYSRFSSLCHSSRSPVSFPRSSTALDYHAQSFTSNELPAKYNHHVQPFERKRIANDDHQLYFQLKTYQSTPLSASPLTVAESNADESDITQAHRLPADNFYTQSTARQQDWMTRQINNFIPSEESATRAFTEATNCEKYQYGRQSKAAASSLGGDTVLSSPCYQRPIMGTFDRTCVIYNEQQRILFYPLPVQMAWPTGVVPAIAPAESLHCDKMADGQMDTDQMEHMT